MKQHNLRTYLISRAFTNIPTIYSAKEAGKVIHKSSSLSRKQISVTCKIFPRQAFEQGAVVVIIPMFSPGGPPFTQFRLLIPHLFLPICNTPQGTGVRGCRVAGRDIVPVSTPGHFCSLIINQEKKTEVPERSQAVFLHLGMLQGFKCIYNTASKSEVVCLA